MDRSKGVNRNGVGRALRLGELAVKKGYLDSAKLERGLREQHTEDASCWPHRLLGQILLEHGWLTPWELEDVVVTMADLASGIERTGETPSDAIPLRTSYDDEEHFDAWPKQEDREVARRYPRSVAIAHPKPRRTSFAADVMTRVPTTTSDAALGDALQPAFDTQSEDVLVVDQGELEGVLPVWDVCQCDAELPVAAVMTRLVATVVESTPMSEVTRILHDRAVPCIVVLANGIPSGIITRRGLRRAGVANVEAEELRFAELGGGD